MAWILFGHYGGICAPGSVQGISRNRIRAVFHYDSVGVSHLGSDSEPGSDPGSKSGSDPDKEQGFGSRVWVADRD